ncbi:hypothetical protein Rsub_04692 [Raphidocelis subcapitata]|uniref:GST N-terminal domain-containing protein n=1 Tax=Raphidocelis subcapitata TaxID=307507 RepID=A0A2V0NWF1_9CHLO|nr:hypothetical protein Rsub_04692 [Raphidocelis subcapitata]|eukprot:GBF91968.1 hypothetical protein Rsub_04692 [Raphidocelis subcapitata]
MQSVHHARSLSGPLPSGERAVLYTHTCCPYAHRALLAFLHKEVPFDLVQVDLSSKPAWFRKVNPRGLVPAVQWRGATVVESVDIVRWLDSEFPGPASLTPADPALRRSVDDLIDSAAPAVVSAGLDAVAGSTGHAWGIGSGATREQLRRFESSLQPLAAALRASGGPFLAGGGLSSADAVLFPFVERFGLALALFHGYDVAAFDGGGVARWLAAVAALPAGRLSSAAEGRLAEAFRRHRSLDWFDYHPTDVGELHPQLLEAAAAAAARGRKGGAGAEA